MAGRNRKRRFSRQSAPGPGPLFLTNCACATDESPFPTIELFGAEPRLTLIVQALGAYSGATRGTLESLDAIARNGPWMQPYGWRDGRGLAAVLGRVQYEAAARCRSSLLFGAGPAPEGVAFPVSAGRRMATPQGSA